MSAMGYRKIGFRFAPEVRKLGVTGVFFTVGALRNRQRDPEFDSLFDSEIQRLLASGQPESLVQDSILAGYRQLHERIGRSNKRFVAAPETLLGLVLRDRRAPRVNLLVDIYNLVSLKSRLARARMT